MQMASPLRWSAVASMAARMLRLLDVSREERPRQVSEIARTVEVLTQQQALLEQLLDEQADARAQLTASRARVVAAADDARRRLERELHDGIQQRLVSLALLLRSAVAAVPTALPELRTQLAEVDTTVTGVIDELREITRGIHPAILSEGGLQSALKVLARRSAVPVELDVRIDRRMPERVEVAAYHVVSEALTNAATHANTSVVRVHVDLSDGWLRLSVDDDGVGEADFERGSGLIGLGDRVEALGGEIRIISSPGQGNSLQVTVPIELA
jgi:signal transduction histidine kinase